MDRLDRTYARLHDLIQVCVGTLDLLSCFAAVAGTFPLHVVTGGAVRHRQWGSAFQSALWSPLVQARRSVLTWPPGSIRWRYGLQNSNATSSPAGVFTSVSDLRRNLMRYIRAYAQRARPVRWTYTDPNKRINAKRLAGTGH